MTHPDVSAIAAIAQHSNESKKMPHIFAGMIKLYDGTQLPYSTHIVSSSWASKHDVRAVKERTLNCILPLSTLASRTICDTLFRQVWKHLISLQSRSEMFNSKLAFDREDKQIERILQEWIDSSLNITLRAKLLKKIFYHEFQFCLDVESNPLIENDTGDIDSYFRVWRQLFKILYHFSMKDFIIPDVKAIHVDRMYLNMEKHLMYHKENPDVPLPNFKYQDQLQEIMFMGHKQVYLLSKLLEHVALQEPNKAPLMAETVQLSLDTHEHDKPLACDHFLNRLKFVKLLEIKNCLNDHDLLTIALSCHHLVSLTITGNDISNYGVHCLAFPNSTSCNASLGALNSCSCTSKNTKVTLSLRNLDIKGVTNVNSTGIRIAIGAFRTLIRISCRNQYLCEAIEKETLCEAKCTWNNNNFEWNSHAIKKLECGLKQKIVHSIFKNKTDAELLSILSKFVPNIVYLTYHFSDFLKRIRGQRAIINQMGVSGNNIVQNPWNKFRELSSLCLTNIIGTELITILKSIGGQLLDITICNISLWDYINTVYPIQHNVIPQRSSLFEDDVRINLFELGMLAPNLKRLSLEMGHYVFNQNHVQCSNVGSNPDSADSHKSVAECNKNNRFEFLPCLKELHIKGVNSSSSGAVQKFLCNCTCLEELVLLTKQYSPGNSHLKFNADDEYELCNIIKESSLIEILRLNPMKFLRVFIASTVDPCPSGCTIQLTEKSLTTLLDVCGSLERIGNLDRWNIQNLDIVLSRIQSHYKWKSCPVFHNSKLESAITT